MKKDTEVDEDAAAHDSAEETPEEIAREREAEETDGPRLAAHYDLPYEVLAAIDATGRDSYE